jgi:GEVED domain
MIDKKNILFIFTAIALLVNNQLGFGQSIGLNSAGAAADASAILDIGSTTQGLKLPNLTAAARTAIAAPTKGLTVYQIDGNKGVYYYNGTAWLRWLNPDPLHGTVIMDGSNSPVFTSSGALTFTGAIAGEVTINFPAFTQIPTILLSNNLGLADPPAPSSYCPVSFTAACNDGDFNSDYLEEVKLEMIVNGVVPPAITSTEFMRRNNTGCEGVPLDNYTAVPVVPPTINIRPSDGTAPAETLRVTLRDNALWGDNMRAWIDYNRDGDFFDLGELIVDHTGAGGSAPSVPSLTSIINVSVPATASNGNTIMRVKCFWLGQGNGPCDGGTWGETEDYTINIINATPAPAPEIPLTCIVKNVTTSSFTTACTALSGIVKKNTTIHFQIAEN